MSVLKFYTLLSAAVSAFWSGLIVAGMHGGPLLFTALFVALFCVAFGLFSLCHAAGAPAPRP